MSCSTFRISACGFRVLVLGCGVLVLASGISSAQQMPDPSVIHGRSFPEPTLPDGTITVRVVREAIGNDAPGQQVRVTAGGTTRTATTDQQGRAQFTGLPRGEARAEATVDGEKLESQPFAVPTSGGLRVILVAGLARAAERKKQEEATALAAPPTKGVVVFGGDSRIVMEFQEDTLWTYYLLEIVNSARTRVDVGGPLRIDLPAEASGARLFEGSAESLQVDIDGNHVTVHGPFPAGTTSLNIQFSIRYSDATHTVSQSFPVPLQSTVVGVEKVGSLGLASPQFSTIAEVPAERGAVFVLGRGGSVPPGTPLTFTLSNLPVHDAVGRNIALGLAFMIVVVGAWLAMTAHAPAGETRKALLGRRDLLLTELAQVEAKQRAGSMPPERADRRRQRLLAELEHIYAELDTTAGPRGGGEGIAA
jgi:hypothetical protein